MWTPARLQNQLSFAIPMCPFTTHQCTNFVLKKEKQKTKQKTKNKQTNKQTNKKKTTQFCYNWVLLIFTTICSKYTVHPTYVNWVSSSVMKTHRSHENEKKHPKR